MKLVLRQSTICDTSSPYNGTIKDILIEDGLIREIGDNIIDSDAQQVQSQRLMVSQGWVDLFAHFNDPGFEYKETLETGAMAAAAGGFTTVFVLPNTQPAVSNKTTAEYILQKSRFLDVDIIPLGAISRNIEGKELAEMYDMHNVGVVAFSDGLAPVQSPGLLLKALQYVKAINKVIIQLPVDRSIAKTGLINEGIVSTQLGLPGIPAIAEELMVNRDIELAAYTQSRLHITGISTAKSLSLVKNARAKGLHVTCSVTPYHLYFSDDSLREYDTNLKTEPPIRGEQDVMALRKGVLEGDIDCIASHHLPQNWDNKICEFEYAQPGMIGLETAFGVVNDILPGLPDEAISRMFSANSRKIFSLPTYPIVEGAVANLTLFDRSRIFAPEAGTSKSASRNSPFFGKTLKGGVLGIVNKDKVYLNVYGK